MVTTGTGLSPAPALRPGKSPSAKRSFKGQFNVATQRQHPHSRHKLVLCTSSHPHTAPAPLAPKLGDDRNTNAGVEVLAPKELVRDCAELAVSVASHLSLLQIEHPQAIEQAGAVHGYHVGRGSRGDGGRDGGKPVVGKALHHGLLAPDVVKCRRLGRPLPGTPEAPHQNAVVSKLVPASMGRGSGPLGREGGAEGRKEQASVRRGGNDRRV